MTDLERRLCSALNFYLFQNVWNETVSEYRANIRPIAMSAQSRTGHFSLGSNHIPLPISGVPFYIYRSALANFNGIMDIPYNTWIRADELCNKYNILLHFFSTQGKLFSKQFTYVRIDPSRTNLIIVVAKHAFKRTGLEHALMQDVYATIYYDSDYVNDMTVHSYQMGLDSGYDTRTEIWNLISNNYGKTNVIIDGYEVVLRDIGDLKQGQLIDVIVDKNILFTFTTDIDNVNNGFEFFSEMDSTHKYLVHIPKDLNPSNKVLTHNTCDFFIRRADTEFQSKGLYVHRCQDRSITQVTHNDFAIPDFIVDAYRDYLETQDIRVSVVVRNHSKDNVLVRDASYIDLLYTHNDVDILKHLMGKISPELSFWKASYLEWTKYIEMFFNIPDYADPKFIKEYIDALGYYHVLALICTRVVKTIITDGFKGSYSVSKPLLYSGQDIYPIVYLNGLKIHNEYITFSNTEDRIKITISNDISYKVGDQLVYELFVDGSKKSYYFEPTEGNRDITLDYDDFVVYEIKDRSPQVFKGIDRESSLIYKKITEFIGEIIVSKNNEGKTTLKFSSLLSGRKYVIQNRQVVTYFTKNIDTDVFQGNPIYVDLDVYCDNLMTVPLLENSGESVFLNGKYLIRGIDYKVLNVTDKDGYLSFKQLSIQNMSYLKSNGNKLEVIANCAEIEDSANGYLIENKAYGDSIALYFDNISMMHIDGILETEVVDMGECHMVPINKHRDGAPFEIRSSVPRLVKDFMDNYHKNDDYYRLLILNNYFYGINRKYPDRQILNVSHKVYSLRLAMIIRDIVSDKLAIALDPDIKRMLDQIKDYDYLKSFDLLEEGYDLKYVDIFPTYRDWDTTLDKVKLIHALTRLILPNDNITTGESVHVIRSDQ